MSRESYEMSEDYARHWDISRGAGDPDVYGYPGSPENPDGQTGTAQLETLHRDRQTGRGTPPALVSGAGQVRWQRQLSGRPF